MMKFAAHKIVLKNGRFLEVREATPSDAGQLLSFIDGASQESTYLTMEPGEFSLTEDEEARFLEQVQKSENQTYIVGELDGVIVGTASLSASNRRRIRHFCELGISVRQSFWRLGIGRALLESVLVWAHQNPILTRVSLSVREDNLGAIGLYRSMNFFEEGRHRHAMYVNGIYYDTLVMGCDV